jgi:hypothetical protein
MVLIAMGPKSLLIISTTEIVYADIRNSDEVMVNYCTVHYVKGNEVPYKHHISL